MLYLSSFHGFIHPFPFPSFPLSTLSPFHSFPFSPLKDVSHLFPFSLFPLFTLSPFHSFPFSNFHLFTLTYSQSFHTFA